MTGDLRPIGVFDSGVGGISVLSELVRLMPNENYIYFGDSANAPYGIKPLEQVAALTTHTADMLVARGCKCLVIACNTATVAAVTSLRAKYPEIPVIGIEPALKPATLANHGKRILVLATHVTLNQSKFLKLRDQFKEDAQITSLEAPGIVEFVERDDTDSKAFMEYLRELLKDYLDNPPDAVVLGCTHYPFVKEHILMVLGNYPEIYDGGNGTARETLRQLAMHEICAPDNNKGNVLFENSKTSEIELSKKLFKKLM